MKSLYLSGIAREFGMELGQVMHPKPPKSYKNLWQKYWIWKNPAGLNCSDEIN